MGSFAISRAVTGDRILGKVTVLDTGLGGLTSEEAESALNDLVDRLGATPVEFTVNGQRVSASAIHVGFEMDSESLIREALTLGRTGGLPSHFSYWLGSIFNTRQLAPTVNLDDEMLESILTLWDHEAVGDPTFEGAIEISGSVPIPVYPKSGTMIDRAAARPIILDQLARFDRTAPELALVTAVPLLSPEDVDAALNRARQWLAGPITLTATVLRPPVLEEGGAEDPDAELVEQDVQITFTIQDLLAAFRSEPAGSTEPNLRLFFDPAMIGTVLESRRGDLEGPPVDAEFEVDENDQLVIIPGRPGAAIDPDATAQMLELAAARSDRTGALPFLEGQEPEVTTADLESLGIKHLVSQFTTFHPCCANRVTNIHTMADTIDGVIVLPGETFSVNEFVGMRTRDKGYLPAPGVEGGEIVDSIGGGVSQFATTFYNAVFYGGYEDVSHTPHSYYFNRYPRGSEATVSWPKPHLIFKNNTSSAILIKTAYTGTSITVKFFSDNDGRSVVAWHEKNVTHAEVRSEGGPNARKVTRVAGDPYNYSQPIDLFISDMSIEPGTQKKEQNGWPGFSIQITRQIEFQGEVTEQKWTVRYRAAPNIYRVHPCENPAPAEGETPWTEPCPTTTTTTVPETTTTTTEGG